MNQVEASFDRFFFLQGMEEEKITCIQSPENSKQLINLVRK